MGANSTQSVLMALLMVASHVMAESDVTADSADPMATRSLKSILSCSEKNKLLPTTFVLYKSGVDGSWSAGVDADNSFYENLDPKKEIVFIIHGFLHGCNMKFVKTTKAAYLKYRPDVQVVTVCWDMAFPQLEDQIGELSWASYLFAYGNAECAGEVVGRFMSKLADDYGVDWDKMSIVSHSLGSQVAGAAGNWLKEERKGSLKKLIALDPAKGIINGYMSESSAEQVIVLHTSAIVGEYRRIGTVDFYANHPGIHQPECSIPKILQCDHYRSVELFIKALEDPEAYPVVTCNVFGFWCDHDSETYFSPDTKATGVYYFNPGKPSLSDLLN